MKTATTILCMALVATAGCGDGSVDPSVDPGNIRGRAAEGGTAGNAADGAGGAIGASGGVSGAGGRAPTCNAYQALCDGACLDVTTVAHCGSCTNACASGQACSNGQCVGASGAGGMIGSGGAVGSTGGAGGSATYLPCIAYSWSPSDGGGCTKQTSPGVFLTGYKDGHKCGICGAPTRAGGTPECTFEATTELCVLSCDECTFQ
jgi:hypothetical protein